MAIPVQPPASEFAFLYTAGVRMFSFICLRACRVFGFWSLDWKPFYLVVAFL
jgi:hypothetical protein